MLYQLSYASKTRTNNRAPAENHSGAQVNSVTQHEIPAQSPELQYFTQLVTPDLDEVPGSTFRGICTVRKRFGRGWIGESEPFSI
jgi:hypothetical protein